MKGILNNQLELQRLKKGLYYLVPLSSTSGRTVPDDPFMIVTDLFAPCYISGWSAASHWDLTEQIFNETMVYTTRPQRSGTVKYLGTRYRVKMVRETDIFGCEKVLVGHLTVPVADPHRTVVDILHWPKGGGGGRHVLDICRAYRRSGKADVDRLVRYASRLGRGTLFKRLGFVLEFLFEASPNGKVCKAIQRRISAGVSNFDPAGGSKGKILSRWNLRINLPVEEMR